jgi:uroporphyrinogen III methyltransferase/synthase
LKKAGCNVTVLPVYETRLVQQSGDEIVAALDNGDIRYVTFTSSSTVENFFELIPADTLRRYPDVKLASIGPVTSKTLASFGFTPAIEPEDYTIPGLVAALVAAVGADKG